MHNILKKMLQSCFSGYAVTMLIFQTKRIFSMRSRRLEVVGARKNGCARVRRGQHIFFLFFKFNLGRSDDAKRRKKRGWPDTELKLLAVLWLTVYPPL